MGFRQLDYESAFVIMGATIMGSAPSVFINIKGHRGLFWGGDTIVEKKETCSSIQKDMRLLKGTPKSFFCYLHSMSCAFGMKRCWKLPYLSD
jgi:hypothetical protein